MAEAGEWLGPEGGVPVVLLDNYDSFTFNLAQYLAELGARVEVLKSDVPSVDDLLGRVQQGRAAGVLLSPGPGTPDDAGVCLKAIEALAGRVPLFGVCLGHQAIGQVYGGRVVAAARLMHGKASAVHHRGEGVLAGLPSPFEAARYHSLAVDRATLPEVLHVTAWTDEGEIMGLRHCQLDVEGVQFHPESILTQQGKRLLETWLARLSLRLS